MATARRPWRAAGRSSSIVSTIGFAFDRDKRDDPVWAPIFEAFDPVALAVDEAARAELEAAVSWARVRYAHARQAFEAARMTDSDHADEDDDD